MVWEWRLGREHWGSPELQCKPLASEQVAGKKGREVALSGCDKQGCCCRIPGPAAGGLCPSISTASDWMHSLKCIQYKWWGSISPRSWYLEVTRLKWNHEGKAYIYKKKKLWFSFLSMWRYSRKVTIYKPERVFTASLDTESVDTLILEFSVSELWSVFVVQAM